LARSILLSLSGHGLRVQVVAVLVEGMRLLRADQAIDGAESQHLPGVLRELDGLELSVVALHSHLHGHPSLVIRAIPPLATSVSTEAGLVPTPSNRKRSQPGGMGTPKSHAFSFLTSGGPADPGKTFPWDFPLVSSVLFSRPPLWPCRYVTQGAPP